MAAASAYTKVTQELYVSYFGRPADTNGFQAMSAALAAAGAPTDTAGLDAAYATNAAVRTLIDSFGASEESRVLYGNGAPGVDTRSFVTQIYNNLFGRMPDAGGLAFWTTAIDVGSLTHAAAAHSILTGALTANNADAALINKKVDFANKFTTSMDTPHELYVYQGEMAARFGRDLLSRVTATSDPWSFQASVETTLAQLGTALKLTSASDKLASTTGVNLFLAERDGAGNALQTGDSLTGGEAVDTLRAVLGVTVQGQMPMPATSSIEHIRLHAAGALAQTFLDATLMNGVTRWENDQSRGDLIIRNVGIQNGQLPEDVTIAMVGTAAGNADFSVHFAPSALRASNLPAGSPTLRLQLMDTRTADAGGAPLKDNPYDGFRFLLNKVPVQVRSAAIDQAQTYDELLSAIKATMAATPALEKLVVSLGEQFQAYDTQSGKAVSGREILITNTGPGSIGVAPGAGWLQPGAEEAMTLAPGPSSGATPLITSSIMLDNVGRGGIGGDLLVGGAPSTGSTAVGSGFEAFNITVDRTSMLWTIDSTGNTLQVVTLTNGAAKGDIAVGGASVFGLYGFHDVRQINAAAMSGKVDLSAVVTAASLNKYLSAPGTLSGSPTGTVDFAYVGGSNNDNLSVSIDYAVVSSRGVRLAGQEDFRFNISGGAGDDQLQARILPAPGDSQPWTSNQDRNHNLTLSGGDGNDTIRKPGAGDAVIDGGAGDDIVFLVEGTIADGVLQPPSDNLIIGGSGNDLIVLGMAEHATAAQSSNDTLIFGRQFGNDKVFSFDASGPGIDHLDVSALGGEVLTNSLAVDRSVTFAAATGGNDTAAKVGALFNADNAVAQTHVYAVVNATGNALQLYAIADAAGAGNAVATLEGTIDFGGSPEVSALTAANFVNAASAGYKQAEGASSAVAVALVGIAPEADVFGIIQT